jgi:hypothetical protein
MFRLVQPQQKDYLPTLITAYIFDTSWYMERYEQELSHGRLYNHNVTRATNSNLAAVSAAQAAACKIFSHPTTRDPCGVASQYALF